MLDEDYMKQALQLASKGLGKTSPNPMVGAVIVKDNRIIGKGYHHHYGGRHAEVNAIQNASEDTEKATLYVTLEPCCYQGKTPPCVETIIQNKIGRVVIGTLDPNPLVNGKSVEILKRQGIETRVGVLEEECRELNEAHFKYMTTGLPLVTLKFAQTLDGRIATTTGNSRWISSEKFRRLAHKLRATSDAIMVGIDTVLADDPELTVRLVRGRNPTRVILDTRLRIPLDAKVVGSQQMAPTIIATTSGADEQKLSSLRRMGIGVLITPEDEAGEVDLRQLLSMLGQRGISSILVEGGAGVITSLLRRNLVDKMVIAVAPKIMGKGIEAVGELNIREVGQTLKLSFRKIYRIGEDLIIEARVNPPPS
ncbi:MAG: bifunctional diaminohydroxyphosphoribosylaminopyrimidine deaminase/5-amino-6-(5-phosphoribosylamino)uracil reductase RibD [Dehalococcoidales bacterium]